MGASECNRRYNEGVATTYASYGSLVGRRPLPLFLLGLVLATIACIGLVNLETANDVLDIWMYKGTRLDDEKDFYDTYFGGGTRAQNVMISAGDNGNAATPLGLSAMQEGVSPLIPGGDNEITYEFNGESFGVTDTCQSATVPSYFKPYDNTATNPYDWIINGAFMSYGYRSVSICAKNGTGPFPLPTSDLPENWGIDVFPCSRLSPLDCFQEGAYDYPEAMQQLDLVSSFVALNNATVTAQCVAAFGAELAETLVTLQVSTEDEAAAAGAAAASQLALVIQAFFTWGYHWRTPYTGMTEAEIVAHLQAARNFSFSDDEATDCILGKYTGGSTACCLSWAATRLETDYIFAEVDDDDGSIKHLVTNHANFPINHPAWISRMEAKGVTSEEDREAVAFGWETAMIDEMTPRFEQDAGSGYGEGETFADIDLDFFTKKSGDDIIENGNKPEPYLITIAYLGMVIFAAVSMGAWNFSEPKSVALYSRVLLSLGGMFVVALSTVACLGFISAIGIKLTPLSVSVVPFLSLGIGIDDMFIFIYTLVHTTDSPKDPRRRIKTTLVHAGPSVTVTSIAVASCFLVASAVAIPTVRFFAIHMGVQMLFHLILLHLMLLPMMYWDSVRVAAFRSDVLLIKLNPDGIVPEDEFAGTNTTKRFVEKFYAPLLRNKVFKAAVIVIAAAATAVLAWYGFAEIKMGVGLNTLAVEGSYEKGFLSIFETKFTADSVMLVTKEVDMGTYQETLLEIQDEVQEVEWVSEVSTLKDNSWLADSFSSLLGPSAEPIEAEDFNTAFATWITGAGVTSANNFYCTEGTDGPRVDCTEFDPETTVIKASQQLLYLRDQAIKENNVEMFRDMRAAVDGVDPNRDTFAYSDNFSLNSQYLHVWDMLFWVVGGGAVMVAVIIAVLQGSFLVSLLMALSIIMVVLQVFGFLTLLDVGLNGFTIVNLCVMVGLVVEFTAHIGRGFLFAPGDDRDDRVEQTLTELLWPTFAGACTTFLAVLPLTFSKISFFHSYYFQTFAIMTALGFFAGICVLPVMLSVVGPTSQNIHEVVPDKRGKESSPIHSSAAVGDDGEFKDPSTL